MKRYGILLASLGLLIILCGALSFSVRLNSFEEFFLKSRLTEILEARGYKVLWEMEQFERRGEETFLPVAILPLTRVIHFVERKNGIFCFFEKISSPSGRQIIPEQSEEGNTILLEFTIKHPLTHIHGGALFEIQGKNKVNLASPEELQLMFPFEEVRGMGDSVNKLYRKVLLGIGVMFLSIGIAFGFFYPIGFAREGSNPLLQRQSPCVPRKKRHTHVRILRTDPPQREKLDPEKRRGELLEEIDKMMVQPIEEERIQRLREIRHLLTKEVPRIKKMEYLFLQGEKVLSKEKDEEIKPVVDSTEESPPLFGVEEVFPNLSNFERALVIDHLLPPDLDPHHVKTLIIKGFLRPTGRRRFIHARYLDIASVRKSTRIPDDAFMDCVRWLLKIGVVMRPKKNKGKLLVSLNSDPDSVSSPGSDIIRVILRVLKGCT